MVVVMGFKNHKEWFRLCMPGISLLAPTGRGSWSTVESRNPRVRIKEGITEEVSTLNLKAGNSCMSVTMLPSLIKHRKTVLMNPVGVFKALNL